MFQFDILSGTPKKSVNEQKDLERSILDSPADVQLKHVEELEGCARSSGHSDKVRLALNELEIKSPYYLVRVAAFCTGRMLGNNAIDEFNGNQSVYDADSMVRDQIIADRAQIKNNFTFDENSTDGLWLRQISNDTIGAFRQGTLEKIAYIDETLELKFLSADALFANPIILPFGMRDAPKNMLSLMSALYTGQAGLIRRTIELEFGISFKDLPLRNEIQFLKYISEKDSDDFGKIRSVLSKPGINRAAFLNTFFACSADTKIAADLILFGTNTDIEKINSTTAAYTALVEELDKIELAAQQFVKGQSFDTRLVVDEFVKRITRGLKFAMTHPANSIADFEHTRSDILLFSALFKTVSEQVSLIDFNEFVGVDLSCTTPQQLSSSDKAAMAAIIRANWAMRGTEGIDVVKDFTAYLEGATEKTALYVLRRHEEIVAFVRYTEIRNEEGVFDPHQKYGGSFNVHPAYRSSAIGSALLDTTMKKESEDSVIHCAIDLDYDFTSRYIEQFGFVITESYNKGTDAAIDGFKMKSDREFNTKLFSKQAAWTQEQIKAWSSRNISLDSNIQIKKFNIKTGLQEARAEVAHLLDKGNVVTHYFADPQNSADRYMVFEKV